MPRTKLVNGGIMVVEGRHLGELRAAFGRDNAEGEFYLAGVIGIPRRKGSFAVRLSFRPRS
jgi:bifunctional N-acetylglucosamine-1-phosphate-uridyltransferase/glucosamine-1-phosphate-acetyltransferase GlmU-like protein